MKKYYFMFLLAAVGFGAVACGGDDPKPEPGPGPGPDPGKYDITVNAKSALGDYYLGSQVQDGSTEFILALSDAMLTGEAVDPEIGGAGTLVFLDLFSQTSAARKGILPDGTYQFLDEGTMPTSKTCWGKNTFTVSADKSGKPVEGSGLKVKSGKVVVTSSGTNYTIVADFVLSNSKTLYCTYTGPITFAEKTYVLSTLTADYVVPVGPYPATFVYVPDGYKIGADVWIVQIFPAKPGLDDNGMQFELAGPKGTFADGLREGTYTIGIPDPYDGKALISNPGWLGDDGNLNGTWYLGGFGPDGVSRLAPAMSGTATVTKVDEKYTIAFEYKDDAAKANTFSGTWTGTPKVMESTSKSGSTRVENSFKAVRVNNRFM